MFDFNYSEKDLKHIINWQKAEGLAMLLFFSYNFFELEVNNWLYPILLFSFDVSCVGYIFNNKIGAFIYNLGHSGILPICLLFIGKVRSDSEYISAIGFLWLAHIGLDRMFGFGLKLRKGFKHTHLGRIGK